MSKDPAFLFYTNDFVAGTQLFTDEQLGKYVRLLCLQHLQGHFTRDDMMLICKSHDDRIFKKFVQDSDGLWYNERLQNEIEKRQNYSKSRGENRKGGADKSLKPKTKKHKKIISKSYEDHMGNGNEDINEIKNAVERLYLLYPTKCKKRDCSTGKCKANKTKIKDYLDTYTEEQLTTIIGLYIVDCDRSNSYLKNFTTFLNQLPIEYLEAAKPQPPKVRPNPYGEVDR